MAEIEQIQCRTEAGIRTTDDENLEGLFSPIGDYSRDRRHVWYESKSVKCVSREVVRFCKRDLVQTPFLQQKTVRFGAAASRVRSSTAVT